MKFTQAQQLLLSALLSMLGSGVVAGITAGYQVSQQGNINIGVLINTGLVAFFVFFGKALYDYVPSHASQTMQALQDALAEIQNAHHTAQTPVQPVILPPAQQNAVAPLQSQSVPLVVIHAASVAPVQPVPPPVQESPALPTAETVKADAVILPTPPAPPADVVEATKDDTTPLAIVKKQKS